MPGSLVCWSKDPFSSKPSMTVPGHRSCTSSDGGVVKVCNASCRVYFGLARSRVGPVVACDLEESSIVGQSKHKAGVRR